MLPQSWPWETQFSRHPCCPTASHSTPGLTAPSATELPTAQPKVPANSRHPGPRNEFPAVHSLTIPRNASQSPQTVIGPRAATEDRPPPSLSTITNGAQAISLAAPSPPFRGCPHAVHRWIRAKVIGSQCRQSRGERGDITDKK